MRYYHLYDAEADFALCFKGIEHIFEPIHILKALNKILKPRGLFIFA